MRIFYALGGEFIAGGQLNALAHVTTLRRWGHDARLMIVRPPAEADRPFEPVFPPGQEAPPWQLGAEGLAADDVVVVGEMFGVGALAIMDSPVRKVIHNQNPFYMFQAFSDVAAIDRWGAEHILCASGFCAEMLREARWTGPISVVRPYVDPVFAGEGDAGRVPAVAYMPRKRPRDARLIRGLVWSRRPDLAHIPWAPLAEMSREECASVLKRAGIFLSHSHQEGLGLPPLEAMAAGALVVGFHGDGGREYATAENGDWFGEDEPVAIADAITARLDAMLAGDGFEARRAAGRATAAQFAPACFEAQLRAAWAEILSV